MLAQATGFVVDAKRGFMTEDLETDRIVQFCGATLQRPHRAVRQQIKKAPSEVYVAIIAPGLPADHFITHINDIPTPDLPAMLTEIRKIGCDVFRLRVEALNSITKVVTMKPDGLYFPTTEYIKGNGEALVSRKIMNGSEA
ncbi:hypothetical protein HBI07_252780 [Parastagonospora nodorum]|nr:hypothetical protein HBI84_250900 [Parastagonospora nodorum]KAH6513654.1 hypothetical protein HBI07_252780 [Parastagonospora nodorum]